ncbi:hypothetical protein [Streptomyces sp. NPDC059564]|uniref:hypothetical protein n=1 Tax=Streptomyces sp. NPDC059564 TaxID=3346865 RepID=UPI0036BF998C
MARCRSQGLPAVRRHTLGGGLAGTAPPHASLADAVPGAADRAWAQWQFAAEAIGSTTCAWTGYDVMIGLGGTGRILLAAHGAGWPGEAAPGLKAAMSAMPRMGSWRSTEPVGLVAARRTPCRRGRAARSRLSDGARDRGTSGAAGDRRDHPSAPARAAGCRTDRRRLASDRSGRR